MADEVTITELVGFVDAIEAHIKAVGEQVDSLQEEVKGCHGVITQYDKIIHAMAGRNPFCPEHKLTEECLGRGKLSPECIQCRIEYYEKQVEE